MANVKEVATELLADATKMNVRFPKVWDESMRMQTCGATIVRVKLF